jgi:predicted metal-dependent peptidase
MNRQDSLSKTSKDLMLKEPYYGFFLLMLHKSWSDQLSTAGVCKNGINFQLMINEKFWTDLSEEHKLGLLKHELLHIAFQHLTTFTMFSDKKMANIAMDMEINQYIDGHWLPEGGIDIDDYPDLNLDRRAGSRYYYDQLKQAQEDKKQNGSCGCKNMDKLLDGLEKGQSQVTIGPGSGGDGDKEVDIPDHEWEEFENMPEAEKKLIEKQVNRVLTEAKEQTIKKRGFVPGEISGLIKLDELIAPKFNWKAYIRRFTGISTKIFTRKVRRKENKRYSDNPGLKIKMRQNMLVAIDTSGSVCDSELKEFINEIHHLYKAGVDITIAQCDSRMQSIKKYDGKFELEVAGRGGTSFDPALELFNERKEFTSLIYFTDGEAWTNVKPRKPVLWVLSERSDFNDDLPGRQIKLEL